MRAAPWIAGYLGLLVAWALFLTARKTPTLWKGRALLIFNAAFVVIVIATILARTEAPDPTLTIFSLLLIVIALFVRDAWLILHVDRPTVDATLEKCFRQTRAEFERTRTGYVLKLATTEMIVALSDGPVGIRLAFTGEKASKKAKLICALIGKQFKPGFPVLRIRT